MVSSSQSSRRFRWLRWQCTEFGACRNTHFLIHWNFQRPLASHTRDARAHSRKMLECCPEALAFWRFSAFFCTCLDWNWDIPRKCGESSDFLGDHVVTDHPKKQVVETLLSPITTPLVHSRLTREEDPWGPRGWWRQIEAVWNILRMFRSVWWEVIPVIQNRFNRFQKESLDPFNWWHYRTRTDHETFQLVVQTNSAVELLFWRV